MQSISVTRGTVSRLRFIASNAFSMYTISIDSMNMEVISLLPYLNRVTEIDATVEQIIEIDGTAVEPYWVSAFSLNVAQVRLLAVCTFHHLTIRVITARLGARVLEPSPRGVQQPRHQRWRHD
jgi:hypothetical protein